MPWIAEDHSGKKFGKWTCLERVLPKRPIKYLCRCECGNEKINFIQNLTRGLSTRCPDCANIRESIHLIGKKFNFLTILSLKKIDGKVKAEAKCDCGNICLKSPSLIKKGTYKRCGKCNTGKDFKIIKPGNFSSNRKLNNKRYGCLTIISKVTKGSWLSKCDCGNEKIVKLHHLRIDTPSCGCYKRNIAKKKAVLLIGLKWGYLKIVKFLGFLPCKGDNKTRAWYQLKCKCGSLIERDIGHMYDIASCGCMQSECVLKGSANNLSKTNEAEVSMIRSFFKTGLYTRKDLCDMTGLKYEHICKIINNKNTWKHVKCEEK